MGLKEMRECYLQKESEIKKYILWSNLHKQVIMTFQKKLKRKLN